MKTSRQAWVLSIALAACGAPGAMHWENPGATEATVRDDVEKCGLAARHSPMATQPVLAPSPAASTDARPREEERAMHASESFQMCMRERGYSAKR